MDLQLSSRILVDGRPMDGGRPRSGLAHGIARVLLVTDRNYVSMLWTHPLGIRMLIIAGLMLAINFGAFLGLCLLFNHRRPAGDHWVLGTVLFVSLYLPVVFVIMVGPVVIMIEDNCGIWWLVTGRKW
jgi:hypothetical protein